MSILEQLACAQNSNREVPNQELAKKLAESLNPAEIRELAENLWNKDAAIASDCIKVLYEIGYLHPQLIVSYCDDFLKLLRSRNNRLAWGGMIALSTVAALQADELYPYVAEIQKAVDKGSVITVDAGVQALAGIAGANLAYNRTIFPYLLEHLRTCRPKDVPQHAEKTLLAVNGDNGAEFIAVVTARFDNATASQLARLKRVIRQARQRMDCNGA